MYGAMYDTFWPGTLSCIRGGFHSIFGYVAGHVPVGSVVRSVINSQIHVLLSCVTGVLGPHSNAHGPNEFLDIGYCKKVITCVANVVAAHYTRAKPTRSESNHDWRNVVSAVSRIDAAHEDKLVQLKGKR